LSRDCRRIMMSERYRSCSRRRGCRRGIRRWGADFIIIDDPLKPEEALSQAQRQAANEWYDHTLYSRLNDKLSGAIVLVMHRLHESLPSGLTRGTTSPVT